MLGGILLKLEPICLLGFFLSASKYLRPCDEVEKSASDAAAEAEANGRASAVATLGHVENTKEIARAKAARILDQLFIFFITFRVSDVKMDILEEAYD